MEQKMNVELTKGCILQTYNGDAQGTPTVQVIDIKKLGANASAARYRLQGAPLKQKHLPLSPRLVISDGVHYQQAMLATDHNSLVESNRLSPLCIIRLTQCTCTVIATKHVVIVIELEIIHEGGPKIGTPVNVVDAVQVSAQPPAPAQVAGPVPGAGSGKWANLQFHPISSLNPYQNRWTIKARVTTKSEMRTWNNARGEGRLFSVDLLDAEGGQIRATMFNDAAVKFFALFAENKVYVVSKGQLKLANKTFSKVPNEYELTLNASAEVELFGDDATIQATKFAFCSIDKLATVADHTNVDVIGVVNYIGPMTEITTRAQKKCAKRTVGLVDQSCTSVEVTFWDKKAEQYNETTLGGNAVLALKNVAVSDFGGKCIKTTFDSQVSINPDVPETLALKQWYASQGHTATIKCLTSNSSQGEALFKTITEVESQEVGRDAPAYFKLKGFVSFVKHERDPWYMACPSKECNKKVTSDDQGGWLCDKCDKVFPTCNPRYLLEVMAQDATGSMWLSVFDELAEKLLGKSAAEMMALKQAGDDPAYEAVYENACFHVGVFRVRAKADTYQDETRVRCSLVATDAVEDVALDLLAQQLQADQLLPPL